MSDDLDYSNCRCSRHHTCDWCKEHWNELRPATLEGDDDT